MPLYFAYGSNMDRSAMAMRCPRASALGPARLMRHRLDLTREGWLTVIRDPQKAVHGILWDLSLSDMPALDRYEGVAAGLYVKAIQPIIAAGRARRALIYIGAHSGPGIAPIEYIESVIAAARQSGLPVAAIEALRRFLPQADAGASGRARTRLASPLERN